MTATRDLIAAALTLADIDEHVAEMPTTAAADVREMCALAMVQPVSATDVPMPEPTTAQHRFRHTQKLMPGWSGWQPCEVQERPTWEIDSVGYEVEYRVLFSPDQMRKYGDAREAAGYARGLKEAGKLLLEAPRWRDVADELPQEAQEVLFVRSGKTVHGAWIGGIFWHNNQKMAAAYWMPLPNPLSAALSGEVKP